MNIINYLLCHQISYTSHVATPGISFLILEYKPDLKLIVTSIVCLEMLRLLHTALNEELSDNFDTDS